MAEFLYVLRHTSASSFARDAIAELCGGAARVSTICARRKLTTGENFDLLTGYDLNVNHDQQAVWYYLETRAPVVVMMSPVCTPFGPMGTYNSVLHPESWRQTYETAVLHGRFCGRVARHQVHRRREHQ